MNIKNITDKEFYIIDIPNNNVMSLQRDILDAFGINDFTTCKLSPGKTVLYIDSFRRVFKETKINHAYLPKYYYSTFLEIVNKKIGEVYEVF